MKNQYIDEMVLENSMFDGARASFNQILQKMLRKMIDSDVGIGSITLKCSIELNKTMVDNYDRNIDGEERVCIKPKFDHKVTSQVSVKDESKGTSDPDVEIRWDAEKNCFVTMPVANSAQRSMFDDDMDDDGDDDIVDSGTLQLPGPTNMIEKKHTLQDVYEGDEFQDYEMPDDYPDDDGPDDGSGE